MVLKNILKSGCLLLLVSCTLFACNEDSKPIAVSTPQVETKAPSLFPFHKAMEIKPGYYFEVLSWGKGVDSIGGFLILMSDSVRNHYKSIAVERTGIITDAWNMDLDNDGNPEIYIQTMVRENVADLTVYEYGNDFNKISFPGVSTMKGYNGDDKFFTKNGDLYRSVPIAQIDSGKTITLVKTLKYRLSGNSFSSSEVKLEE